MADTVEELTRLNFKRNENTPNPTGNKVFKLDEEEEKKTYLITLDTCGHCEEYKKVVKDELDTGEITEVPCSEDEGKAGEFNNLLEVVNNNIELFPTLLDVEKTENGLQICERDLDTGKKEKCRLINKSE